MSDRRSSIVDALRQPEYVGENRCLPCTVLNVAIAVGASAFVAARADRKRGRALAAALGAGSLATIALRGYLVPGTPELTKRYLPDRVLAAFGKAPTREGTRYGGWESAEGGKPAEESELAEKNESVEGADSPGDDTSEEFETVERLEYRRENEVDPEAFLAEIDAVEATADGTDLRLSDGFAVRVDRGLERYREEPRDSDAIASLFGVDREAVTMKDREYPAASIGRRIRKWPSDGALAADLATADAIDARTDDWGAVPGDQRVEIVEALRAFHEACPICSGPIEMSSETVESCCRSYEVVTLGCGACETPLLEFDPDLVEESAAAVGRSS